MGEHQLLPPPALRRLVALFVTAILFLGPPAMAHSREGPGPLAWSLPSNLSASGGRSTFPAIGALKPSEGLIVLWIDYSDDPRGEVLSRYRAAGADWGDPVNLSASGTNDEGAVLFADAQGRAHAAWTRRATQYGSDLLYRVWESGSWSPTVVLDHTATYIPGPYSLFFVEDAGGTLCLFVTLGSGVRRTCLHDGVWEPLSPWVYVWEMQGMAAIVAGGDGLFHAAVLGENEDAPFGCDPWLNDAYYTTTPDGLTWAPLVNVTYTGTIAYDAGLAFDPEGVLHFLWSDISPRCSLDSERSAVYEKVLAGGVWSERRDASIPRQNQAVEDLELVTGSGGMLHLAWSEGLFNESGQAVELHIYYRRWAAGEWMDAEMVWDSSVDSINVSLALYRGLIPALVWEEGLPTAEDVYFSQRGKLHRQFFPLLPR